jgi:hypothetical protein
LRETFYLCSEGRDGASQRIIIERFAWKSDKETKDCLGAITSVNINAEDHGIWDLDRYLWADLSRFLGTNLWLQVAATPTFINGAAISYVEQRGAVSAKETAVFFRDINLEVDLVAIISASRNAHYGILLLYGYSFF